MPQPRSDRRDQILQALVAMLEAGPDAKITTAKLAAQVGVSEAALYRHFPSKTKMFEALIEFAEETIFSRVARIVADEQPALEACNRILILVLGFCERNPGITRILHGEALAGEPERLHQRVGQIFDRLETQLRTTLRQAELREQQRPQIVLNDAASMMLALAEGRIAQFVRSQFKRSATDGWEGQWQVLSADIMRSVPSA
jgi:TetR/AcrR family transcriptional regulator